MEEQGNMETSVLLAVNPGSFFGGGRAIPNCKLCCITDTGHLVIFDLYFKRWKLEEKGYHTITYEETIESSGIHSKLENVMKGQIVSKWMTQEIGDLQATNLTATPEAKAILTFEGRGRNQVMFIAGDDLGIEVF
jgi:hypothetical protein